MALLATHGYNTSRAKIYKLTSMGEIPHNKYGNKLVFSRTELLKWAENRAVRVKTTQEAMAEIDKEFKQRSMDKHK